MSSGTALSDGLRALVNDFAQHEDEPEGISIEQAELGTLLAILRAMQLLATNLEIEVRCLRDMEASGAAHVAMEEEATEQLSELLGEMEGKIIRPDFGGRS